MGEVQAQTLDHITHFRCLNYSVIEIWECAYDYLVRKNDALKHFIAQSPLVEKLNPRDAFFGGRTNPSKLHHVVAEGEVVRYCDFVSLYPYNKYWKMPVGHPDIIPLTGPYASGVYYGLLNCKILPPTKLFHPVLPYQSKKRLLFPYVVCVPTFIRVHYAHTLMRKGH